MSSLYEPRGDSYKTGYEMKTVTQRLGEIDDGARFRWLCQNPDWRFVEELCQDFAAKSSQEFYKGLCAAIDKRRRMESSADQVRNQINAAMAGIQPIPWSGSK